MTIATVAGLRNYPRGYTSRAHLLAALLAGASSTSYGKGVTALKDVGDYIRQHRESARISLRQLAEIAGVSNPYLSQIERGLRKPSAEILQQIAKALRISAEALYVQAGILDERAGDPDVLAAVMRDGRLTDRQKQVLLDIYESFVVETARPGTVTPGVAGSAPAAHSARPTAAAGNAEPRKAVPRKAVSRKAVPRKAASRNAAPVAAVRTRTTAAKRATATSRRGGART